MLWALAIYLLCLVTSHADGVVADSESTVYRATYDRLQAITPSGQKWIFWLNPNVSPLLDGDLIFIQTDIRQAMGDRDTYYIYTPGLTALNSKDGTARWEYRGTTSSLDRPAAPRMNAAGEILFDNKVFEPQTGARISETVPFVGAADWSADPDVPPYVEKVFSRDGTVYPGNPRAINVRSGRIKWETPSLGTSTGPVIAEDGTALFVESIANNGQMLTAMDPITGDIYWQMRDQHFSRVVALKGNTAAVVRGCCDLIEIDVRGGNVLRRKSVPYQQLEYYTPPTELLVLDNGMIYIDATQTFVPGNYKYADSGWPKHNARNNGRAGLNELGPAQIVAQPAPALVRDGKATFSVNATGTPPLFYQWFKGSEAVEGATNADLTTAIHSLTETFSVIVSNAFGMVASSDVTAGYSVVGRQNGGRVRIDPRQEAYSPGARVTASATSFAGRSFVRWRGIESTNNPLDLVVSSDLELIPEFETKELDLIWSRQVGPDFRALHTTESGRIYAASGGRISVFEANGNKLWDAPILVRNDFTIDPDGAIVTWSEWDVRKYRGTDGSVVWSHYFPYSESGRITAVVLDPRGTIFVAGPTQLTALTADGTALWTNNASVWIGAWQGPDGIVYGTGGDYSAAIDPATGKTLWQVFGGTVCPAPRNRIFLPWHMLERDSGVENLKIPLAGTNPLPGFPAYSLVGPTGRTFFNYYLEHNAVYEWTEGTDRFELSTGEVLYDSAITVRDRLLGKKWGGLAVVNPSTGLTEGTLFGPYASLRSFVLDEGRIVTGDEPGQLNTYQTREALAPGLCPMPGFNPRNTRSALRLGAPMILTPPRNEPFIPGSNARFALDATGTPPLTYDWYRNGKLVQSSARPQWILTNVLPSDKEIAVFVNVRNPLGEIRSGTVGLGDGPPPLKAPELSLRFWTNGWEFVFSTSISQHYVIEQRESLSSGSWEFFKSFDGLGSPVSTVFRPTGKKLFFRVQTDWR